MSAVVYRLRAELRRRWLATFLLLVLIAPAGGVVLTAAAGARRTASAYDRLVEETRAWDLLVNPDMGNESALDPERVAALPQVESFGYSPAIATALADAQTLEEIFDGIGVTFAPPDGVAFFEIGRPNVLEGRMPRRDRVDEVLVDRAIADRQGLEPGDALSVVVATSEEVLQVETDPEGFIERYRRGEIGQTITLTVTGIGVAFSELVVDEGFDLPVIVATPAFYREYSDATAGFWGGMVRLRDGASERELRKTIEAMVPDETIEFQSAALVEETVEDAVRPYVVALNLFAVAVGLTALLVIGQALARQRFVDGADDPALQAVGFTRGDLVRVAALRTAIVALGGAAAAATLAWLASRLMPLGPVRDGEPDPGLAFDGFTLGIGALAMVVLVLGLGLLPTRRGARSHATSGNAEGRGRVPAFTQVVARSTATPVASTGVRMAFESGRGRTAVPARTTLVGAVVAVATVVAALTFAAGLDRLLTTPRLFGVTWDVRLAADMTAIEPVTRLVKRDPDIAGAAFVAISRVELDRQSVPAVALDELRGDLQPTLVSGRIPERDDELALGAETRDRLGVDEGDRVTARFGEVVERLTVVGTVVLPGAGNYPGGDKTGLGRGAVLSFDALARLSPPFGNSNFLVRFRDGVDVDATTDRITRRMAERNAFVEVEGIEQPAGVVDLERVRATPVILALMLAALGVATVAHALVTTVRRRRRDLALLKTLGFTRPQVSAAVACQASTVALVALLVGVPVGVAAGRWGWSLLAEAIGTIAEPVTPWVVVLLAVPGALVVTNLVAAVPAWLAGRTRAATALRSE